MSFMAHLLLFVILYNSTSDSQIQTSLTQNYLPACMAASFIYDRTKQFTHKFYTFLLITITSWSLKTQRRKLALVFIVLNFILLVPYILPLILLSSLLSAPILPLFTFPIFILGYPRSKRFWPTSSDRSGTTTNPDSFFYSQITLCLLKSLRECILTGSIGSSIEADSYFLTRFQDRIIWIQVLEVSGTYCLVNIKGLELQETSCHTREAQYIDDSFEATFESRGEKCSRNKFDCFQSCDLLILKTYSDAKNTLVGILDSPDSFQLICAFYPKILHYFLVKYLMLNATIKNNETPGVSNGSLNQVDSIALIKQTKPNNRLSPILNKKAELNTLPDINQMAKPSRKLDMKPDDSIPDWSDTDSLFDDLYNNVEKPKILIKNKSKKKNVDDLNGSDEFDASIFDIIDENNKKKGENNFEMKNVLKPSSENGTDDFVSNSILSIPLKWSNILKNVDISRQNDDLIKDLRKTVGSASWFNKVLESIEKKSANQNGLVNDYQNNFTSSHFNFLMKCYNCLGLSSLRFAFTGF
jgi:hypothetical protein